MCRKVESDRKPLLPGGEIATVEGVRLFGARVARILPDGPRPLDIHGGVGAAHVRRDAGETIEAIEPGNVACAVNRRDANAFRRQPGCRADIAELLRLPDKRQLGKIGNAARRAIHRGSLPRERTVLAKAARLCLPVSLALWPAKNRRIASSLTTRCPSQTPLRGFQ